MKWIAKPALWLLTTAIPVVIAACYGVYEESRRVFGKVVDGDTGEGIQDIQVECVVGEGENEYVPAGTMTLPGDGAFELWVDEYDPCDKLVFKDLDGEENGAYADKEIPFDEFTDGETVELEAAE